MNRTTFKLLLIPAALLLLAGLLRAADLDAFGEKEFKATSGGKLVIDNRSGGSAEIVGWDKDMIHIVYADGRNDRGEWDVDFDQIGDTLEITSEVGNRHIDSSTSLHFEIKVPKRFDIEFESAGGSLDIRGVEGYFRGETAGGELTLIDVKGEVRLRSGGGEITVRDSELDGRLSTGGGEVLVENVVGNVKATSGGGEVRYRNVRDRDGEMLVPGRLKVDGVNKDTVVISNAGGRIRVKDAPQGAVVRTGGGDVRVTGADKFVRARTGGGDVEIALKAGWVKASTGAGDIEVTIEREGGDGDLVMHTGLGEVELTVPKDMGMDFEIDLRYTRQSSRDFEIDSDFKMDVEETEEWIRENGGTPLRHIYGTGSVNGGGRKVRIVTTNGNVVIKRR